MRYGRLVTSVFALALLPAGLSAQSIGIHGGVADHTGTDLRSVDVGYQIGADAMLWESGNLTGGIAAEYSRNGLDLADGNATVWDAMAVARWTSDDTPTRLFVGGRAGYSRLSMDRGTDETESTNGWVLGPEFGVIFPAGGADVELGLVGTFHNWGEVTVDKRNLVPVDHDSFRLTASVGVRFPLAN